MGSGYNENKILIHLVLQTDLNEIPLLYYRTSEKKKYIADLLELLDIWLIMHQSFEPLTPHPTPLHTWRGHSLSLSASVKASEVPGHQDKDTE